MIVPSVDSEIVVGTYEDYVVGYQVETFQELPGSARKKLKTKDNGTKQIANGCGEKKSSHMGIEQSFAVRGHSGSVKCLSCSSDGALVFSTGQDEMMNLFSLRKRKLVQTSEGSITCSNFVENSHLLCGSDDGNVYIYECKSSGMKLVKTLKGHKAGITSMDTHPTGKILLTLSRDKTMRTWNLIKGRCAYVTYIRTEAHIVKWSKSGSEFLIAANKEIYLYNEQGKLKQRISLEKRVNSLEFLTADIFAVATDSGKLEFFKVTSDDCQPLMKFDAHESRIKSIKCLAAAQDIAHRQTAATSATTTITQPDKSEARLVTAASDGVIKIWSIRLRQDSLEEPIELASVDVGARITCMVTSVRDIST